MSEHDPSEQSISVSELSEEKLPSQQIIELIGEKSDTPLVPTSGTDPDQTLPPLHSVIDPDALDSLVGPSASTPNTRIEFSYHGYSVTVCTDRPTPVVRVQPQTQPTKPCPSVSADD